MTSFGHGTLVDSAHDFQPVDIHMHIFLYTPAKFQNPLFWATYHQLLCTRPSIKPMYRLSAPSAADRHLWHSLWERQFVGSARDITRAFLTLVFLCIREFDLPRLDCADRVDLICQRHWGIEPVNRSNVAGTALGKTFSKLRSTAAGPALSSSVCEHEGGLTFHSRHPAWRKWI